MAVRYENAPILEALIDIRVDLAATVSLDKLETLHHVIEELYPRKDTRVFLQGTFPTQADSAPTSERKNVGFQFTSSDGKQIFQARLDGFTFSRLRPYGTWKELRSEAERLWELYRRVTTPTRVTRIAVRYINRIEIPTLLFDYKEYFRTTPEVSPDLPQGLSGFLMQLNFPQEDIGGMVVLTETPVAPIEPETAAVILDLDAFRVEPQAISDEEMWEHLEVLRERKNQFFEGSITDRTRQLFGAREEY